MIATFTDEKKANKFIESNEVKSVEVFESGTIAIQYEPLFSYRKMLQDEISYAQTELQKREFHILKMKALLPITKDKQRKKVIRNNIETAEQEQEDKLSTIKAAKKCLRNLSKK